MKKLNKIARLALSLAASFTMLITAGITASAAVTYGDVDSSGSITAVDASLILRHAGGLETLSGDLLRAADVDGNGSVSAIDASLVLQRAVNIIDKFPAETTASDTPDKGKTLVVYYSATGSTKRAAGYIANATGADIFELIPQDPYSSADLDWTDSNSRVVREHDNESLRNIALVNTTISDWSDYDTVFIGYPIWWGIAAWPVNSFVSSNDFGGKAVIPFCTSASSGLGDSGKLLAEMASSGDWLEGYRFASRPSESDVGEWLKEWGF